MKILPHYFIETSGPEHDCHHYICKWLKNGEDHKNPHCTSKCVQSIEADDSGVVIGKGYGVILECHEDDSMNLCNMMNIFDPWGEEF